MYVHRRIEPTIRTAASVFPVVMVTGPRQAGKKTLLQYLREPDRTFVSLDDLDMRLLAQEDPKLFLARFPPPVLIDEFQYAPDLLPYIKIAVDERATRGRDAAGLFWLTGSQHFVLMKHVRESLAGRVAIFSLLGMDPAELTGTPAPATSFFNTEPENLLPWTEETSPVHIFRTILGGSMPGILTPGNEADTSIRRQFYSSYVQTYLERDVASLDGVRNLREFELFFRLLAGRAGQLVNYAGLAREVGVSAMTIRAWTTILERSFHILTVPPYYRSLSKRLVKTPKVYFLDSGLHAWLTGWHDPETALDGPMAGQLLENWVVGLIVRSAWHRGEDTSIYFWRTSTGQEVDIWHEQAGRIATAEVKLRAGGRIHELAREAFRPLAVIDPSPYKWGRKHLITLGDRILPLDHETWQVPVQYIS